jgi:protease-4
MNAFNIRMQSVKAGPKVDLGNITKALKPEDAALLKEMANEFYDRFREVVLQQRKQVDATLKTTFDGRVFTASQALKLGLIDRIGYLGEALDMARELACQPTATAVLFHRCNDVARTPYATTPNVPLQASLIPFSVPGADRYRLPTFLYLWQPDPTLLRLSGQ